MPHRPHSQGDVQMYEIAASSWLVKGHLQYAEKPCRSVSRASSLNGDPLLHHIRTLR